MEPDSVESVSLFCFLEDLNRVINLKARSSCILSDFNVLCLRGCDPVVCRGMACRVVFEGR